MLLLEDGELAYRKEGRKPYIKENPPFTIKILQ